MERNTEFIKKALEEIESNCKPNENFNISIAMKNKGYDLNFCLAQLKIMENANYIVKSSIDLSGNYLVSEITNLGYDFLDKLRDNNSNSLHEKPVVQNITYDQSVTINGIKKMTETNINTGNEVQQMQDKKSEVSFSNSTTNNGAKKQSIISRIFSFFKGN